MIARIDTTTIARIIDPKPFEPRANGKALPGDAGRKLQAMRKAGEILEHRANSVEAAARAFLAKYAALEPALNNAFAMAAIRGAPYCGETWAAELKALRDLLPTAPKNAKSPSEAETPVSKSPRDEGDE